MATATSPLGPFKDALGKPLITTSEYGGESIHPYVFIDDDGSAYLYFGSSSAGGHVVPLNADMVSFKGTPQALTSSGYQEGSVAFKRNGIYYFMWSEGDTRSADYEVAYGTGKSPLGPFTRAAVNPILQKDTTQGILGTGHNSVLELQNGDRVSPLRDPRWRRHTSRGVSRSALLQRRRHDRAGQADALRKAPHAALNAIFEKPALPRCSMLEPAQAIEWFRNTHGKAARFPARV